MAQDVTVVLPPYRNSLERPRSNHRHVGGVNTRRCGVAGGGGKFPGVHDIYPLAVLRLRGCQGSGGVGAAGSGVHAVVA